MISKSKKSSGRGKLTVHVKTAKKRTISSTRWLQRQLNDIYVTKAQDAGYRSRAAFKLIQLDEKYKFLGKGKTIVDLGCAPGGWTQLAVAKNKGLGQVIGLDILPTDDIAGATLIQADFTDDNAPEQIRELLNGKADIVLSDMAANTIGHKQTDHLRTIGLVEMAYHFAKEILADKGIFIAKVFQGGAEANLLADMRKYFEKVSHFKPDASRKESSETYLVAVGFKGNNND